MSNNHPSYTPSTSSAAQHNARFLRFAVAGHHDGIFGRTAHAPGYRIRRATQSETEASLAAMTEADERGVFLATSELGDEPETHLCYVD